MLSRDMAVSARERNYPGFTQRVQGYMEICIECGSRYRRMATEGRPICGRCYPTRFSGLQRLGPGFDQEFWLSWVRDDAK